MRYQAALRPDRGWHLGRRRRQGKVRWERKWRGVDEKQRGTWVRRATLVAVLAMPALYLAGGADRVADPGRTAAGPSPIEARPSTSPTTASTPTSSCRCGASGLDWAPVHSDERLRRSRTERALDRLRIGRGASLSGDARRWRDITPRTIWSALTGGKRVMHVEYVPNPDYAVARDPPAARGIPAPMGRDPRRLRARCARAGRSGSTIQATAVATLSTGRRQVQRAPRPATAGPRTGCGLQA